MKKDELVNELLAEANRQSNETADLLNRAAEIIAEEVRETHAAGVRCIAQLLRALSPDGEEWRSSNPNSPAVLNMRKLADKLEAAITLSKPADSGRVG